jgi:hypothetical protein
MWNRFFGRERRMLERCLGPEGEDTQQTNQLDKRVKKTQKTKHAFNEASAVTSDAAASRVSCDARAALLLPSSILGSSSHVDSRIVAII